MERLLSSRLEPVIDPQFPQEHDFVLVLVDLSAAYDTVWQQGLILKLLCLLPDRKMVHFIANTLSNRRFVLKTSCPRTLKNGVP